MRFPFFITHRPKHQPSSLSRSPALTDYAPARLTPATQTAPAVMAGFATANLQKPQPKPQPQPFADAPANIPFRLRSLIALVPDPFLAHPRGELSRYADLERFTQLPTRPMLPQLSTGRISLPLAMILDVLPPQIPANPRPSADTESVILPLSEVVAHIPPQFFTAQLFPRPETDLESIDGYIPAPFQEGNPAPFPAEPAPVRQPERIAIPVQELEPVPVMPIPVALVVAAPALEPTPEPAPAPTAATEGVAVPVPQPVVATVPEPVSEIGSGLLDEKKFLIDLNRCRVEDLLSIKGLGPSVAQRIIEYRAQRGRFNSLDELRQVPGVGRKTIRTLTGTKAQSLNKLLGLADDRELTLQEIVRHTGQLPGLQGCLLATADGLFRAGEWPPPLDAAAIGGFAPQWFKRVTRCAKELKVGETRCFTLFTDEQPVSIFGTNGVFLVVIHDRKHFSKRRLHQCERINREIARLYRPRLTV